MTVYRERGVFTRRAFLTAVAAFGSDIASPQRRRPIALIEAPSNLGLRPLRPGHEPGTWRAAQALRQAGLAAVLSPTRVTSLARPQYQFEAQPETRIRNGQGIRRFSEDLALCVRQSLTAGEFPLVIGGDCSILLGCLFGAGPGRVGLVHVDGHSDFYHAANYDTSSRLGSAAGMDLALATGRGEKLLAAWEGRPLVADRDVVQIGERDELSADYDYRDIEQTEILRIPVRWVLKNGVEATIARALASGGGASQPRWLHVDLDVLDERVMAAVDSPGRPGLQFDELARLIAGLMRAGRIVGADVAIFDPELDPMGTYARAIVACLGHVFGGGNNLL